MFTVCVGSDFPAFLNMKGRDMTKQLHVSARKWFDRSGNTYHTVALVVDGEHVHSSAMTYGYGDSWEQTARDWLKDHGFLPGIKDHANGGGEPLWHSDQQQPALPRESG